VPVTPAPTGAATIEVEFTGAPYAVTLVSDGSSLGRVAGAGSVVQVDAGTLRLRAVSEAVFLDADLGVVTVRPGERKRIAVPGTASVVLGVRGDEYAGVRIWVDGRPLLGPYPAQVARVAAGSHQVSYRWSGGSRANLEISETVTLNAGAHYVVRAVPDNGQLVVQQVR
jgi:hypothetical protein